MPSPTGIRTVRATFGSSRSFYDIIGAFEVWHLGDDHPPNPAHRKARLYDRQDILVFDAV